MHAPQRHTTGSTIPTVCESKHLPIIFEHDGLNVPSVVCDGLNVSPLVHDLVNEPPAVRDWVNYLRSSATG